jgi:catechol 2,3-dioxygenase-like lactoylglutathione lyase family enzyme
MRGRVNADSGTDRWKRKDWWGVNVEAPDPRGLLAFWSEILGVPIHDVDDTGGSLDFGEGVGSFTVQHAEVYEPPVWPPEPGRQGMQMHIEVEVDDLAAAVEHAVELGATVADHQPQDDVRVMLDPAGHPFCLYS